MPVGLYRFTWISRFLRCIRRHPAMLQLAALFGFSLALQGALRLKWYLYPFNILALYLSSGGWRFARVIWFTLGRDIRAFRILFKVKSFLRQRSAEGKTVGEIFHGVAVRQPNLPALINAETGESLTFGEVEILSNKVAHLFKNRGYQKDDCVAIMMDGCPEYVCYWLGLSKIGVVGALINYSLRGDPLTHCITIVNAKAIIYGTPYTEAVKEIKEELGADMEFFNGDGIDDVLMNASLPDIVKEMPTTAPEKPLALNTDSKVLYIYTSGTTGLPKAATIRHSRCLYLGYSLGTTFNTGPQDIGYISLPLYHSNGGLVGVGNCLFRGMPCVIRKKFSASRFVDDCVKHKVTVFFYIGEICRYLLGQPKRPEEKQMTVRVAIGNGLQRQIWEEFQTRFNIKLMGEFYGATETNAGMVNAFGKTGSVGFTSMIAPYFFPLTLVKVDPVTGDILRGSNGLALICGPGEPGELVGKIRSNDPLGKFDGYVNQEATKKKIAHDVLSKGDSVFRSGDILVMDELGYFFFMDRTGDTFRWKGENVSTTEVETTISKSVGLLDVVCYGVEVPGNEGKAGMVTIADPDGRLDLEKLAHNLKTALPSYARPLFLRIAKGVNCTGTFKFKKVDLRKEGYDQRLVGDDQLFFLNSKTQLYEKLERETYNRILNAELRL